MEFVGAMLRTPSEMMFRVCKEYITEKVNFEIVESFQLMQYQKLYIPKTSKHKDHNHAQYRQIQLIF